MEICTRRSVITTTAGSVFFNILPSKGQNVFITIPKLIIPYPFGPRHGGENSPIRVHSGSSLIAVGHRAPGGAPVSHLYVSFSKGLPNLELILIP
jgi:hypothetical protein